MKTLISLTAASLMVLSTSAFAAGEPDNLKASMNNTVKTYVDAITYGKLQGLPEVLDKDVKFTLPRAGKLDNFRKQEMLDFLKRTENIRQNCTTNYQVLDMSAAQAAIKVTMQYETFTRVNIVNMVYTAKGWKITNVSSSFV